MSRHGLRGTLIIIILLTIPCYIIGFGILIFTSQNNVPTPSPNPIIVTDTEIVMTEIPLESSPTTFTIVTIEPISGITLIAPTAIPFSTATPRPTAIPSNTPVPTATFIIIPTSTEQIILPASDTPDTGG